MVVVVVVVVVGDSVSFASQKKAILFEKRTRVWPRVKQKLKEVGGKNEKKKKEKRKERSRIK